MVNIISDYIPPFSPLPNIAPFTYKDGETYLSILETLRKYFNDVVVSFVNTNFTELSESVTSEVNTLISSVNDQFATQNQSITDQFATQNQSITDQFTVQDQDIADNITVVTGLVGTVNGVIATINAAVTTANAASANANAAAARVDITAMGAVANSVNDQTALVLAAMNTVPTNGVFWVSDGVFNILNLTTPPNIHIMGPGTLKSKAVATQANFTLMLGLNTTIENVTLDGNVSGMQTSGGKATFILVTSNNTVKGCTFQNCSNAGVATGLLVNSNIWIRNNHFIGSGSEQNACVVISGNSASNIHIVENIVDGNWLNNFVATSSGALDTIEVSLNHITGVQRRGMEIQPAGGVPTGVMVIGNVLKNVGQSGINVSGHVVVSGNVLADGGGYAIETGNGDTQTVSNNTITNYGAGIHNDSKVTNITISGNTIHGITGVGSNGIDSVNQSDPTKGCNNINIIGNTITDIGSGKHIMIPQGNHSVNIIGNICSNVTVTGATNSTLIRISAGTNVLISDNSIFQALQTGLSYNGAINIDDGAGLADYIVVKNNVITYTGAGVAAQAGIYTASIGQHNIFSGNIITGFAIGLDNHLASVKDKIKNNRFYNCTNVMSIMNGTAVVGPNNSDIAGGDNVRTITVSRTTAFSESYDGIIIANGPGISLSLNTYPNAKIRVINAGVGNMNVTVTSGTLTGLATLPANGFASYVCDGTNWFQIG